MAGIGPGQGDLIIRDSSVIAVIAVKGTAEQTGIGGGLGGHPDVDDAGIGSGHADGGGCTAFGAVGHGTDGS